MAALATPVAFFLGDGTVYRTREGPEGRAQDGNVCGGARRLVGGLGVEEDAPAAARRRPRAVDPDLYGPRRAPPSWRTPRSASTRPFDDVVAAIEMENLNDLILVGHSYGGMVATGVADRARARVAHWSISTRSRRPTDRRSSTWFLRTSPRRCVRARPQSPSSYGVPPNPMGRHRAGGCRMGDPAAACRNRSRRSPHRSSSSPSPRRRAATSTAPKSALSDTFGPFAARAKREDWRYLEIDASHNPHIAAPAGAALDPQPDCRRHDDRRGDRRCGARPARQRAGGTGWSARASRRRATTSTPRKSRRSRQAGGVAAALDAVAHCDVVLLAVFDPPRRSRMWSRTRCCRRRAGRKKWG